MSRARSTAREPTSDNQGSGRLPAVKALTIRQPWAWATIYGGKDVENRRRRTAYRGPLLIHAGKNPDPDPGASSRLLWTMADPGAFRQLRGAWQAREAIIGVVHLADVLTGSAADDGTDRDLARGDIDAFARQAAVCADLRLFGACARLTDDG